MNRVQPLTSLIEDDESVIESSPSSPRKKSLLDFIFRPGESNLVPPTTYNRSEYNNSFEHINQDMFSSVQRGVTLLNMISSSLTGSSSNVPDEASQFKSVSRSVSNDPHVNPLLAPHSALANSIDHH